MLAEEIEMNSFLYTLFLTTLIFSNTIQDSLSTDNKIIIPEIEIYGGLDENSVSTNIEVITNDNFNINGNNNFQDLLQSIPSLHYAGGTSRAKYFQLRGLGELSQFAGEGAPHFYVGYIVDNIDFSGIGTIGKLYDMQQIEIFKGPQSSTYGPNAMAGVINIVSNKPSKEKSFNFNTSIYSNNGQNFSFTTSLPLTDKLLSKITGSHDYNNGFIKNISDIDNPKFVSNSKDETLLRYQLAYNPNTQLSFNIVSYFINSDNRYDVWTPDNNGFTTYSDFQGTDKQKTYATSINTGYKLKDKTFTSITTYSNNNIVYSYDGDWGNLEYWEEEYQYYQDSPTYFHPDACEEGYDGEFSCNDDYYFYEFTDITKRKRISYSQEFRLKQTLKNNLTSTSGIYLSKLKETDRRDGWLFAGAANNIDSKFDIFNYAIYTQISYPISNDLIISSTLRYDINETKQDLKYEYYEDYIDYNILEGQYKNQIKDNKLIGGTIKINYQYNDNLFFNSSLSRGYKTSGINQTPLIDESLKVYNTEYCNNIDFGINYLEDDYSFKFSTFYMHRYNPQLRLSYQVNLDDPTSFDYATFNADYGYNYGFELDINLKASDNIVFNSYISYLNTFVSNFDYLGSAYGNRLLAHTPQHKYGFNLKYDMSKTLEGLSLNMSSNFVGSFYFEEQNNIKSNPYNLIDISINYNIDNLGISLWSKNFTNTKYVIRGYQFVLDPTSQVRNYQSFGDPRTIGMTLNFNF